MSLEFMNESNLRAFQRHCDEEVEKRRTELERAALDGDMQHISVVSGMIQELRHQKQVAEAQIRKDMMTRE